MASDQLAVAAAAGITSAALGYVLVPVLGIGGVLAIAVFVVAATASVIGISSLRHSRRARARRQTAERLCPIGPLARPEDVSYTVTSIDDRVRVPRFADYAAQRLAALLAAPAVRRVVGDVDRIGGDITELAASSPVGQRVEDLGRDPLCACAETLVLAEALRHGVADGRRLIRWTAPSIARRESLELLSTQVQDHLRRLEGEAQRRAALGELQWRAGRIYDLGAPHGECCTRTVNRLTAGIEDLDKLARGQPGPVDYGNGRRRPLSTR